MKLDKSFGKNRKKRCGDCDGCKSQNCGLCIYCKDSKKFGGPDKMKQVCKNRTCTNLIKRHQETTKNSAPILPNEGLFHSVGSTQVVGSTYWDSPAPEVLDISNEHYVIEQGSFAMNEEEIKDKAETPKVPYVDDDIEQEKIKNESDMRRKRIEKPPKALQKYRLKNQMWLRKPKIMSDVEKGQACPAVEKFVSLLYSEDVKIDSDCQTDWKNISEWSIAWLTISSLSTKEKKRNSKSNISRHGVSK